MRDTDDVRAATRQRDEARTVAQGYYDRWRASEDAMEAQEVVLHRLTAERDDLAARLADAQAREARVRALAEEWTDWRTWEGAAGQALRRALDGDHQPKEGNSGKEAKGKTNEA